LIVAHLDLDAFFAAVEELENPTLRTQPLVVGGDPNGRGVVSTANYVARQFGVHSAMSCAEARRRCPKAVFVRPRHRLYSEYSREVWNVVREVCPTVERLGLDEGYLDVSEVAADFAQARAVAEAVQAAVIAATRLTASLGVASCKVVAKVASDRRKPGGLTVVPPGREAAFLAPLDVRILPGVGPRAEARLRAAGIDTIGFLASLSDEQLSRLLPGKVGRLLRDRALGIDPRPLETDVETISISNEETFDRDVADREQLHDELRRMSSRIAERLVAGGQTARTITTKVRYPDFAIRSRSQSLPVGTDNAHRIGDLACSLLDRALADRPGALRLVGVGVSNLEDYVQLALTNEPVPGASLGKEASPRAAGQYTKHSPISRAPHPAPSGASPRRRAAPPPENRWRPGTG
jgi:DNA polymerase-4